MSSIQTWLECNIFKAVHSHCSMKFSSVLLTQSRLLRSKGSKMENQISLCKLSVLHESQVQNSSLLSNNKVPESHWQQVTPLLMLPNSEGSRHRSQPQGKFHLLLQAFRRSQLVAKASVYLKKLNFCVNINFWLILEFCHSWIFGAKIRHYFWIFQLKKCQVIEFLR